jgi:hypothetical protein
MDLETYQRRLIETFSKHWDVPKEAHLAPADVPDFLPPHRVEIFARAASRPFYSLLTNGIGRRPQRYAKETGAPEYVELLTYVDRSDGRIALLLSYLGRLLHLHEPGELAWKVFDTVALAEPIYNLQYFVLGPGGTMTSHDEPELSFLIVVPVTEQEYARIKGGGAEEWYRAHAGTAGRETEMLQRWAPALKDR